MRRITISIDDELLATLERLGARRGYGNPIETLRDMIREAIGRERSEHDGRAPCLATLTYVYEHEKRDLARRLDPGARMRRDDHVLFYNCSEPPRTTHNGAAQWILHGCAIHSVDFRGRRLLVSLPGMFVRSSGARMRLSICAEEHGSGVGGRA